MFCSSMRLHAVHIRKVVSAASVLAGEFPGQSHRGMRHIHKTLKPFGCLLTQGCDGIGECFVPILVSMFLKINLIFYRDIFHIENEALHGCVQ